MFQIKLIVMMAAVAFASGALMHFTSNYQVVHEAVEVENYADNVLTALNHEENTCQFIDSSYFDETYYVRYHEKSDEVNGRWTAGQSMIELMQPDGLTVHVVAHEVSHAVDTLLYKHQGLDKHYEAYAQGALTECVVMMMEHDLIEAGQLKKFNFN